MAKATNLRNSILEHLLGGSAMALPSTLYLGLYITQPDANGDGGAEGTGDYARMALPAGSATWAAASGGSKTNAVDLVFPIATSDWGTIVGFGLFTDAAAGDLYYFGELAQPTYVATGQSFTISAGNLIISES